MSDERQDIANGRGRARRTIEKYRAVLNRRMVAFLASMFVLQIGTSITTLAIPLFIVDRFSFGIETGLALALRLIPTILVGGLAAQVLARRDARQVAVASALVTALLTGLIPLATAMWHVELLSLATGLFGLFTVPALMAIRGSVISQDQAMTGNGLLVIAERTPAVLGPAIAVPILALAGPSVLLFAEAVFTAAAGVLILALPRVLPSDSEERPRLISLGNFGALWRMTLSSRRVQGYVVTGLTYTVAMSVGRLILIAMAADVYVADPSALALLLGAMSLGAIVGGFLGSLIPNKRIGLTYLLGNVFEGVIWLGLLIGGGPSLPVALGFLFFVGVLESVASTAFFADLQLRLSPSRMGQFFALFLPLLSAGAVLGTLLGGYLAPNLGLTPNVLIVVGLIVLPMLLYTRTYARPETPRPAASSEGRR